MKLNVKIMPKNGVLDPQGKAIENSLNQLGFNNFSEIRQGKIIEIDIDEEEEKAISIAEEMCKKLLVNLIIEDYEIIFDREK
ncbi:MAG: phosphoribosylformylglycinamidine synthase subunit PurS [Pseudomonadota bacterium]|jgi:phosphoribosylformylglycinamidine synthase|nr:phosphoribosylformylglycinamidine synthase [Rhodobiaceae bacterium]MDP6878529.1 phosphoribosylformylglycinamidine synthase subunit PurS [Candidatus Neomarinimicrobiota bacterium]MEC9098245.1 phosphoribosylformylglycinamidine synthase subunit PurS [Pseudomonadota bacterium]MED5254284.1 phosphoribosylformylglycinamidine synthase subunit PurS [Pseudomonadota bacterium]MED5273331.1 phosphoribosylformylglycinamidine synthase subunit PurS [Pseudomonadota bacterium]|tara:strand:+ start:293 stop:538 length:246 start_codon:yes stop_codon:yes gene_type:complete